MTVHRLLREGSLGAQVGHFQRLLLRQAGRHDFAKQAQHLAVAQGPVIPLQHAPQDLRLALRPVKIHGLPRFALAFPYPESQAGALADQRLDLLVQPVDLAPDLRQVGIILVLFSQTRVPAVSVCAKTSIV